MPLFITNNWPVIFYDYFTLHFYSQVTCRSQNSTNILKSAKTICRITTFYIPSHFKSCHLLNGNSELYIAMLHFILNQLCPVSTCDKQSMYHKIQVKCFVFSIMSCMHHRSTHPHHGLVKGRIFVILESADLNDKIRFKHNGNSKLNSLIFF